MCVFENVTSPLNLSMQLFVYVVVKLNDVILNFCVYLYKKDINDHIIATQLSVKLTLATLNVTFLGLSPPKIALQFKSHQYRFFFT